EARGAEVEPLDGVAPGLAQRLIGGSRQVELAEANDVASEEGPERPGHVLADLVAAGPDRGADGGRDRGPADGGDPRLDEACEEAAPAGVENAQRRPASVHAGEGDR